MTTLRSNGISLKFWAEVLEHSGLMILAEVDLASSISFFARLSPCQTVTLTGGALGVTFTTALGSTAAVGALSFSVFSVTLAGLFAEQSPAKTVYGSAL